MTDQTERKPIRELMEALVREKQLKITNDLASLDSKVFHADEWVRGEHGEGGGGKSMVLQDGTTYEKGGVNISVVHGVLPPAAIEKMRANHKNIQSSNADGSVKFFACGLSMVIHPWNPHAPTTHLNYRYFEIINEDGTTQTWWFGGGADLTPSYLYPEDAKDFHLAHKNVLDEYNVELYPAWKKWCDEYFYITHRGETRGIGGIFFDDYDKMNPYVMLEMIGKLFDSFTASYVAIVARRKDSEYTEKQKQWQQVRRGRYVEFNLVYDRGTKFGLQTPGSRIESILMSLPMTASWLYDFHPEENTEEAELEAVLKAPIDWA